MNDQIDESIPVLTEIISDQNDTNASPKTKQKSHDVHFPLSSSSAQATAPIQKPINAAIAAAKEVLARPDLFTEEQEKSKELLQSERISPEEWANLEQTIRENVLRQVLARVDFVLEHRVSDSLADVLQTAVDRLAQEIRAGLRLSVEEVVTRAITQEINKIQGRR